MKKILTASLVLLVILSSLFTLAACKKDGGQGEKLYTSDTELGVGATVFTLIVEHFDGTKINFTINTDKTILSDALIEVGILKGHDDKYGLYIDSVNGIAHDFDKEQIYWAIYVGDAYATTGIDGITVNDGATYKLVASK